MNDEMISRAQQLHEAIRRAMTQLNIHHLATEHDELQQQSQEPDFWQDSTSAQQTMKRLADIAARIQPWQQLAASIHDVLELSALGGEDMADELTKQLDEAEQEYDRLKSSLRFAGPYDHHSAIVSIYAGAGGTDAQDWAQMLQRMYLRWAENESIKTEIVDESVGDEAGIKSTTMRFVGTDAYGKLKSEHGVHRLVRQSPFNSAASRETSFAKVDILPEIDQPEDVEIDEKDLKIDVYRSGGHGGQSVNTTDSAVRVTHVPTGITVAIQNERSQLQNKETAMMILRSRLAQLQLEQHAEKVSELKGPDSANEFGSQIRNYVLHPYKQVKDLRSGYETSSPEDVLAGDINPLIDAYLDYTLGN
jgi:peptide chain release factor 2